MPDKRLAIIDGYSLLYRAFFATRFLSTADGRPTNALFGFTSMLFYLLEHVKPDAVIVALDAPGKTFRHAEFEAYKGTRREQAPELTSQLPTARELIAALGIQCLEVTGFEADDVIGTVSRQAEENGYFTTIVTGDLDTLQLVDECVSVLTMRQGVSDTVTYTPAAVVERYGFGPEFVADYKALVGDTSDNIPGVPGIGAKSATELIQKFGHVEEILERLADVEPKYRKKIEGNEEQLKRSKRLATIDCHAPIEVKFQPFVITPEALDEAKATFEMLEFRTHLRRADVVLGPYVSRDGTAPQRRESIAAVEVQAEKLEVTARDAASLKDLESFVGRKKYAVYFAPAPMRTDLFDESERIAYVAVGLEVVRAPESMALTVLEGRPERAILHDAKPVYRRLPADIAPPGFDTLLGAYVLQSGRAGYALRDLIQGYLEIQLPTSPEELAGALVPLEEALRDRIEKESQTRVLTEMELPLVPVLAQMENLGICADRETLREFSKELQVAIDQSTQRIYELAGCEFLIASPKQLGEVLFERMGIAGAQKTKTGYATGAEVLGLIPHPIAQEVLNWRELTKLKSTYADSLEKLVAADGRIHTTYNQTGAATGRLSSQDPNLQNIPIRTELGRSIRKAFHADDGYRLASFDYSQIELRVLAHMCEEPALVRAFSEHEDVHTATARLMFKAEGGDVSKEQRRLAKLLNYAVLYGVSEFGLAQQLGPGFSIAEAKALMQEYNERFPTVKGFMGEVVAEARSKGYTTTLLGRRRYFPDIHTGRIMERKAVERQAMNAPIQGTAADMMKLAMVRCHALLSGSQLGGRKGKAGDPASRMLLTVHDEIVFELARGEEELIEPLREAMVSALPLKVPVEVDAKVGENWLEMRAVEPALA